MQYSPLLLFSLLVNASAGLIALVIFVLSFKRKGHFCKKSLRYWSAAFFLITFMRIPNVMAGAGITLTVADLISSYYIFSLFISVVAFLLIYRGTVVMITAKKIWITIFPVIVFVIFVPSILVAKFVFNVSAPDVIGVVYIFYYLCILFMIVVISKALWEKTVLPIVKSGVTSIIIGWVIFLTFNTHIWIHMTSYHEGQWFFALICSPYSYLGFTIGHFLILIGFILVCFGERSSESGNVCYEN